MNEPKRTYDNGVQDAWIEAIRENCALNVGRIEKKIDTLADKMDKHRVAFWKGIEELRLEIAQNRAKVNHIYGFAAGLGAVAGIVTGAAAAVLLQRLFF